ncbi:MAG: DUF2892 domain-containing protein [Bdellovibrionales bacterium]|jgi:uncharacterized membrane protein
MTKNICPCERIVRIVAGLALASLAFWGPQSPWFLLGLIPVLVGAIGWCPLYTGLGINRSKSCETTCCCKNKKP